MDWVLDKVVDQSDCGASVGNTKITDLVFADDAVIFAESLEVLVMALEALHEEAKPLGLEVSWLKTKVQVFGDLLDEAVQSTGPCTDSYNRLQFNGLSACMSYSKGDTQGTTGLDFGKRILATQATDRRLSGQTSRGQGAGASAGESQPRP
ncbi:hypothetical protein GWK47_005282 [Chionoecetes opilio]|uniref:Reverse transcriptase domain-containing protein n=1 Tax=Chionoecetes opilio TaxID=41210 RepID=A0A8J4YII6_CHIOP|nr:hypothetical protein GWK47_005282 [Chionoecetes opilio]